MSAVPWAPDLPQRFMQAGYSEGFRDNVLREQMDVGPPKLRRRSTVQVAEIRASFRMTDAQKVAFKAFYRNVLFEGTVAFALEDPEGESREYYIVSPPQIVRDDLYWLVQLDLQYTLS